jgi:hypothetical protein
MIKGKDGFVRITTSPGEKCAGLASRGFHVVEALPQAAANSHLAPLAELAARLRKRTPQFLGAGCLPFDLIRVGHTMAHAT